MSERRFRFFDSASTTQCCDAAVRLIQRFAAEDFGNPSSSHAYGQAAAKAIREARLFFAQTFQVGPDQIIFTGSGSEADNLAVYGVAMQGLVRNAKNPAGSPMRVLCSATEHPAVRKTVASLASLGFEAQTIPVDPEGQIRMKEFLELLTPSTVLVSIQQVNNITGAILPVEDLARKAKEKVPGVIFHTDAVQAFGKVPHPQSSSQIDLLSISAHKIKGPKGVGALVVLNKKLLQKDATGLRPLIWGGEQEGGYRSGTQNAGLIAGFHAAAEEVLRKNPETMAKMRDLQSRFRQELENRGLVARPGGPTARLVWNSPGSAAPHIISLSIPNLPSGPYAKLLEERGFLVSTGSACSSQKVEPDAALAAMGFPPSISGSALRVSFCDLNTAEDVVELAAAMDESLQLMAKLLGSSKPGAR